MATTERPVRPAPILNWKGMRRWSAGKRAPTICKLFIKSSTTSTLAAMTKIFRQAISFSSSSSSARVSSAPAARAASSASPFFSAAPSPAQARASIERCTSFSSSSSMRVGAIAIANCLRRHSDAIGPPRLPRVTASLSRFSIDSAQPYYPTTSYLENCASTPDITMLGSCSHEKISVVSMGSPMVAKMKDTYANFVHTAARRSSSRHPLDLLVGNPFLTRLNPAPISSFVSQNNSHVCGPSSGLLNASKARDLHLDDRIVFFL